MVEVQLSSGQGPEECELAVGKLLRALQEEFPSLEIIVAHRGRKAACYRSVRIRASEDLSFLEGTVQWICESPYRPGHKRRNWFVDISLCGTAETIDYDESLVRFETFRSGGKGGQHVNKVETGVRAIHVPTGIATTSTNARSQHLNKQLALSRLCDEIAKRNQGDAEALKALNRLEHLRLERGNAIRVYEGMAFTRRQTP